MQDTFFEEHMKEVVGMSFYEEMKMPHVLLLFLRMSSVDTSC